jgi:hypothetical protein
VPSGQSPTVDFPSDEQAAINKLRTRIERMRSP